MPILNRWIATTYTAQNITFSLCLIAPILTPPPPPFPIESHFLAQVVASSLYSVIHMRETASKIMDKKQSMDTLGCYYKVKNCIWQF